MDKIGKFGPDRCRESAVETGELGHPGEKRVSFLRYFVLLSALTALAGCKGMKNRKGFDQKLASPGVEEVGEGYVIDPNTGQIIFGVEPAVVGGAAPKPEKSATKPEEPAGVGGVTPKPVETVDAGGAGSASPKHEEPTASGKVEKAGETKPKVEDPRVAAADDFIEKVIDTNRLISPSAIVLPSRDAKRDVTFSSSGREVTVHIEIPTSHLAKIKSRLAETMGNALNFFFKDNGRHRNKETLRKRLLEADLVSWGKIGSANAFANPNWPVPVSIDDPVLVELTRAVTEKFTTKRGKMQAINDFATKAIKYIKDRNRFFSKPPLLTLADGFGDCKDFSPLVAAMGKIVEVDCAFVEFGPEPGGTEGHIDVACDIGGEGTAFELDGKSYDWMKVTTFTERYGSSNLDLRTDHDGIGVLDKFFGRPDTIQPILDDPDTVENLTASGRLILNEDRLKSISTQP